MYVPHVSLYLCVYGRLCICYRIFVNMDDNIVEHYSNHSAFLIDITEVATNRFHITLMEL